MLTSSEYASLNKQDWPCTKLADAGSSLNNKALLLLLLLLSSLCSTSHGSDNQNHAIQSMSKEVCSAIMPSHQCIICNRRCRMAHDMHAGQNGTSTGFGAAAHTNGTQDEDEQTEPEEAVRCLVASFSLLDSSNSCCTSISFDEWCSKITKVDVGFDFFGELLSCQSIHGCLESSIHTASLALQISGPTLRWSKCCAMTM